MPFRRDQDITSLEDYGDLNLLSPSEPAPRLSIDQPSLQSGKLNFVIDEEGWLIVGTKHHHLLSGGHFVGGAGHIYVNDDSEIYLMQLNFSGHYRPPLTSEYLRYSYRTLAEHPLVLTRPDCEIRGRKFDEQSWGSALIAFEVSEMSTDDETLDERLEMFLL